MPRFWIVTCPEPHVKGGIWAKWFAEQCVAVGWPPRADNDEGQTAPGWAWTQSRLAQMAIGDKVIPFLLKWRIGPVGTVKALRVDQWLPTVEKGAYRDEAELGRRIDVQWETQGMPPVGHVAVVPIAKSPRTPLARHTVEEISERQFDELVQILRDNQTWQELTQPPTDQAEPPTAGGTDSQVLRQGLALLERDLQRFLTRNLELIEPGLKSSPEFQLEELITDVGRLDLFCIDKDGGYVVVELKAGVAGDDAIGQISGYMSWVRENVPGAQTARGIIVCGAATERVRAAVRLIPGLTIKRYRMTFDLEDLE